MIPLLLQVRPHHPLPGLLTHLPTSKQLNLELPACLQGLTCCCPYSDPACWLPLGMTRFSYLCLRDFYRRALSAPPFYWACYHHQTFLCWPVIQPTTHSSPPWRQRACVLCVSLVCVTATHTELILSGAKQALAHHADGWKFQTAKSRHPGEGLWLPQDMAEWKMATCQVGYEHGMAALHNLFSKI